jgi:hypothetical protein
MEEYNYGYSLTDDYVLTLDGQEVFKGTEAAIWRYLHRNHGYSVSHALKYEGYKIEPQGDIKV